MKKAFTAINLPVELVEELKIWRLAFSACYCKNMTYSEMIRGMLDSLEDSDPAVVEEFEKLLDKRPELVEKVAKRKEINGNE